MWKSCSILAEKGGSEVPDAKGCFASPGIGLCLSGGLSE